MGPSGSPIHRVGSPVQPGQVTLTLLATQVPRPEYPACQDAWFRRNLGLFTHGTSAGVPDFENGLT